jgi:NAD(P)-dependent dehydrogenase (short-subunit alcohol dehydrogenase family)
VVFHAGDVLEEAPFLSSYTATKHGVLGLTRAIAVDYAAGIRCNCVLPGDMSEELSFVSGAELLVDGALTAKAY